MLVKEKRQNNNRKIVVQIFFICKVLGLKIENVFGKYNLWRGRK
jgi:hypothetical protein